jgi:chorismate--pyruvate lyase
LQQSWQFPAADEKTCLGITARTYALVREVLIVSEGKKWMFARTVFPRDTLTGKQQRLARLKNRALGSVLFKDLSTERHEFEMARVDPGAGCHAFILQHADVADKNIWARRSVFFVQNKPLLLTEFFLPDITSL